MIDTPEKEAFVHYLMRDERLRALDEKLSGTAKITQEFLKHALGVLLYSNMDLEHKLSIALLKIEELERKGEVVKESAEYFARKVTNTSHPQPLAEA